MEKVFIQNDLLKVGINIKGAEICSIQANEGKEYMWQADPKFWGRHSCVLFPYIGKVWNDQIKIKNKLYESKQHGFARNLDFETILVNNDQAIFRLNYTESTLKVYPYRFRLEIKYILDEKEVHIIYKVVNLDDQTIHFSLGAHPAFNVPLEEGEKRSDYMLEFEKNEKVESLNIIDGFRDGSSRSVIKNGNQIPITDTLFDEDALIFKEMESAKVHLLNAKKEKVWTFNYSKFSYLGIWSKNQKSPFVCIEPWFGVADTVNAEWEFKDKDGVLALEAGKHFSCKHSFKIY